MGTRASRAVVAVAGIVGMWFGLWLGQPTASVRYWSADTTATSMSEAFAWWSRGIHWPSTGLRTRLDYLGAASIYPFWRFALAIVAAAVFACVAAWTVERVPLWRVRKLLRVGNPVWATIRAVEPTGRRTQGLSGMECEFLLYLDIRGRNLQPCRTSATQFFGDSALAVLRPGKVVALRYDRHQASRVSVAEP